MNATFKPVLSNLVPRLTLVTQYRQPHIEPHFQAAFPSSGINPKDVQQSSRL